MFTFENISFQTDVILKISSLTSFTITTSNIQVVGNILKENNTVIVVQNSLA